MLERWQRLPSPLLDVGSLHYPSVPVVGARTGRVREGPPAWAPSVDAAAVRLLCGPGPPTGAPRMLLPLEQTVGVARQEL